jgi:Xaa-Pro aminopeptidase
MLNVMYLCGFHGAAGHAYQDSEPHAVFILARDRPHESIAVVMDTMWSYFLRQSTWVRDIRPYGGAARQFDLPPNYQAVDRFIPRAARGSEWASHARATFASDRNAAVSRALRDLGLTRGRVGCDNPWLSSAIDRMSADFVDAYGLLKYVRAVKTTAELDLLHEAAILNQTALERTVSGWSRGLTWRELAKVYQHHVVDLGGHCQDPYPFVIANPHGDDDALLTHAGLDEDYEIEPGTRIMFDTHGTWFNYCWDGGKTWNVENESSGLARKIATACGIASQEIFAALRPGSHMSDLQALGRRVLKQHRMTASDHALIFFHGVGLEHGDIEFPSGDGIRGIDWRLEKNMVVALHVYYPGNDRERYWLEDVVAVGDDGSTSLYEWNYEPL